MERQAGNVPCFNPRFLMSPHFILKLVQMILHLVLFGYSLKFEEEATHFFDLSGRNSWVSLYMILINCVVIIAGTFSIIPSRKLFKAEMLVFFTSAFALFALNIAQKFMSSDEKDTTHFLVNEAGEISYSRLGPGTSLLFQFIVIISQSFLSIRTPTHTRNEGEPADSEEIEMDEFRRSSFQSVSLEYFNESAGTSQIRVEGAGRPESILVTESALKRKLSREESFSPKRQKSSESFIETMTLETSKAERNLEDSPRACLESKESLFSPEIEMPLSLSVNRRSKINTGLSEEIPSNEESKTPVTSGLQKPSDSASAISKSSSKQPCTSSTSPNDSNSFNKQGNISNSSKDSPEAASSSATEVTVSSLAENGDDDSSKISEGNILSRRGGKSDTMSFEEQSVVLESSELTLSAEKSEDLVHISQDASISVSSHSELCSGAGIEDNNSSIKEKSQ